MAIACFFFFTLSLQPIFFHEAMNIDTLIKSEVAKAIVELYNTPFDAAEVQLQMTRKEFEGDVTVVVFPFLKRILNKQLLHWAPTLPKRCL
jgi:hypothetical protein